MMLRGTRWRHRKLYAGGALFALIFHLGFMASPLHAADLHAEAPATHDSVPAHGEESEPGLAVVGTAHAADCGLEPALFPGGPSLRVSPDAVASARIDLSEGHGPSARLARALGPWRPFDAQALLQVFRI
jgi:hypothetical protein